METFVHILGYILAFGGIFSMAAIAGWIVVLFTRSDR